MQIGTEADPFLQQATITLYGHPKSIELPTFGSKVLACYACTIDMHGAPGVAWTSLGATASPGDVSITLVEPVSWPVGARLVVATTDFESPLSSHSELATVQRLSDDGRTVMLGEFSVCSTYTFSGDPTDCEHGYDGFKYPHLGEAAVFAGRRVEFRAEVGLLSRNIVVRGDPDDVLCPEARIADDGRTRLSCNQFGAQMFFHSPGHESLKVRLSNVEVANAGQAFRLGRSVAVFACSHASCWHCLQK